MTESRETLRIAAEYMCYPTWVVRADGTLDNPDPMSVISDSSLSASLMAWSDELDAIYPSDDPGSAAFASAQAEADFYRRGRDLATQVAAEVGDRFMVVYRDREEAEDVVLSDDGPSPAGRDDE